MLLLALLLFPVAEKAGHDFKHFSDNTCNIKGSHFCAAEHSCSICDYVFSSASAPPKTTDRLNVFAKQLRDRVVTLVFNKKTSPKFRLSLRGPPAC